MCSTICESESKSSFTHTENSNYFNLSHFAWNVRIITNQYVSIRNAGMKWINRLCAPLIRIYDCRCAWQRSFVFFMRFDTLLVSISITINFGVLIELIFYRYVIQIHTPWMWQRERGRVCVNARFCVNTNRNVNWKRIKKNCSRINYEFGS